MWLKQKERKKERKKERNELESCYDVEV
jgi:hypothetical protein